MKLDNFYIFVKHPYSRVRRVTNLKTPISNSDLVLPHLRACPCLCYQAFYTKSLQLSSHYKAFFLFFRLEHSPCLRLLSLCFT